MQLPSSDPRQAPVASVACPDESTMLAFVEGRLAPPERGAIDRHLSDCSECRQLVSALAQGGLVLGETRGGGDATPSATARLDPPLFVPPALRSAPPIAGPTPSSPLLRPGDRVADRYVVEGALGSGGMGVVVAAKHLGLGRSFAIKLLDPRYAGSGEATARFLREARASAKLRGEHVVQVTDMGETTLPDRSVAPFLVMELLEGTDLSKTTAAKTALPSLEAVWIILQACEALAEAHHVGIVHRDIKPANLIVTRKVDGTPHLKVVDFGISKAHDIARSLGALTSQNVVMGTPRYMAPEQMRSSRDVDGRADVWALGAVLYELLAGAPAFDAPSLTELITRVQLEEPVALTSAAPHLPVGLAEVVHGCLRKNPDERIASVADLADALAAYAPAAALHHVERAKRSLKGGHPSLGPNASARPSARSEPVVVAAKVAPADARRGSAFGTVALSLGALLLGVAATATILLLNQRAPEVPRSVATPLLPTPQGTATDAHIPAALSLAPAPPSTRVPEPLTADQATRAGPAVTGRSVSLNVRPAAHLGSAAVSPASTPSSPSVPAAATVAPLNLPPEDPHSLRQRQ